MARLNISVDDKYFNADSIDHGRLVRKFLETLSRNVFNQSYRYWKKYSEFTEVKEVPLLNDERNLYSIFSSAINKITPIHSSELPFSRNSRRVNKTRRVDFWCLNQASETGSRINYFIEIKKAGYCLSKGTKASFTKDTVGKVDSLLDQIRTLKKIQPTWDGDGEVFLGILVIHGYHSSVRPLGFDETQVRDNIQEFLEKNLDPKFEAQLLVSTWTLPEKMDVQWETDKCVFISIAGIAISKKRNRRIPREQ